MIHDACFHTFHLPVFDMFGFASREYTLVHLTFQDKSPKHRLKLGLTRMDVSNTAGCRGCVEFLHCDSPLFLVVDCFVGCSVEQTKVCPQS